jgi:decaprenyl-phosphate phosphoribosyltransferase
MKKLPYIIQLIRPEQWTKNLIVFFPLFFSGKLINNICFLECLVVFFAFSFIASSIYCLNDICDLESDRSHPKKCKRPIPSGKISRNFALFVMILCFILSMLILFLFGLDSKLYSMLLIAFYFVMNIAYCVKLKHYAIIDVVIISIGFVIRMLVGGYATGIWISEWIIIMTFLLALFLAFAKRRDDVVLYNELGLLTRKNTNKYNLEFMNQIITIIATVIIVSYIMWTLSIEIMERFHSRNLFITSIFVLLGIIRYLQITIVDLKSGNPTSIFLEDKFIKYCIVGWIVSFTVIIYF